MGVRGREKGAELSWGSGAAPGAAWGGCGWSTLPGLGGAERTCGKGEH